MLTILLFLAVFSGALFYLLKDHRKQFPPF